MVEFKVLRMRKRSGLAVGTASLVVLLAGCGQGMNEAASSGQAGASSASSAGSGGPSSSGQTAGVSQPGEASQEAAAGGSGDASSGAKNGGKSSDAGRGAGVGRGPSYRVVSVVDGDTIKVRINGRKETIRMIGLDTPETKKPHVAVQCYGKEATSHMQSLVQSKDVQLVVDRGQGERDKYGRLLRYVFVDGQTNVALAQIAGGFGREYTYDDAYTYQSQFRAAQAEAQAAKRGLWGPPCNGFHTNDQGPTSAPSSAAAQPSASPTSASTSAPKPSAKTPAPAATAPAPPAGPCSIKGNINSKGEKIAHAPGSATYAKTRITPSKGERMFCSAAEARAAGWRMAGDQ